MQVENKQNCTGCGACANICSKNAIKMTGDEYGFYKPIIDTELCVNCGLCEKICPVNGYKSCNFETPKVYAFQNSDIIREKSSSGGAFSAFAEAILTSNGIVYGVVWDKDIRAHHYRATNGEEVSKIRGSKYVQSATGDAYSLCKKDLDSGKTVLFTGTPCQIAGLKSFLRKDYENLLTIDVICRGSQAPLFLERYKQEFLKDKKDEKIININFRSKYTPWGVGYCTTDIETDKQLYHFFKDYYIDCIDLTLNTCCTNCQFTGIPRIADITIGDFWGVDEYDKTLNDSKGTSVVILNSQKANDFFDKIKENYKFEEIPLDAATKRNPNILRPTVEPKNRKNFLAEIKIGESSLRKMSKKYNAIPLYMIIYWHLPIFLKNFIKYKILKKKK